MYTTHFGLKEAPFSLTPDSAFFFLNENRQAALTTLRYAIDSGEAFIKITGEVGTGKTTLCRYLLNELGDGYLSAYIYNPQLDPANMLQAVVEELGESPDSGDNYHTTVKKLRTVLLQRTTEGKRVILLVDEAQALPIKTLETLRLLSNLETEKLKLMQIVLFGQPELEAHLDQPEVRQLKQRITFTYQLTPLNFQETRTYLDHRLRCAGYKGPELFDKKSLRLIHSASKGVPRLLNILAHKALIAAYADGQRTITGKAVARAAADTPQAFALGFMQKLGWWSAL